MTILEKYLTTIVSPHLIHSIQNELFSFPENNSNYVNTDSLDIKYDLGISIVHFNARSSAAHIDEIILFLDSFTFIFKIIVITETWLHEELLNKH